jgi:HD-GYP domain-containing protein (c-di-GMP phosphodiesterase class II)
MKNRLTESIDRIVVDSSKASIGMYVSMLDRPWLETPFVFQGFEIKDRLEIELLQSYCSVIYVDIHRSSLSPVQVRALAGTQPSRLNVVKTERHKIREPGKWRRRFGNLLRRLGLSRKIRREPRLEAGGYPVESTVRGEAYDAFAAYKAVSLDYREILNQVEQHGKLEVGILKKAAQPLIDSILRNPDAMAWTIFSRRQSRKSLSRAIATSVWCLMFGRHLGFDRQGLEELTIGGLILDIGNVGLPIEFANSQQEITREQHSLLLRHVEFGLAILNKSNGVSDNVRDMVAYHHERADGSGYPQGLRGNRIPAYGRIAAIADCYDAMTTENAYSPAYAAFDVARKLNDMRGKQFAAEVVEQFLCTMGMFPTASVVELSDGSTGLVLEQNRENSLRPKVMVLLDKHRKALRKPKILEMRDLPLDTTNTKALWISRGHEHGAFGINPMDYFNPSAR